MTETTKTFDVAILGAGIVGVFTALVCRARHLKVCLIDRKPVGEETSYGNAGVFSPSSLLPLNNSMLWKSLPQIVRNKHPGVSYDSAYLLKNISLLSKFLGHAFNTSTDSRAQELEKLISRSLILHKNWLSRINQTRRLRENGWLKLYRSHRGFLASHSERRIYDRFNIKYELLDIDQIRELEPGLNPVYSNAVWIKDALSVDNPGAIVKAYADEYLGLGGCLVQCEIKSLAKQELTWCVELAGNNDINAEHCVVALGPWSKGFLSRLDINLPMLFERGSHREFAIDTDNTISRPIHDVEAAFAATPMENGLRLTSGVQLSELDSEFRTKQLDQIEARAREALAFAAMPQNTDWIGARPTLPDCLPMIGQTRNEKLWLNTGHQHIGFCTAPASAEILVNLMTDKIKSTENSFSPGRYNI